RVAATAARNASMAPSRAPSKAVARAAVVSAARRHAPGLLRGTPTGGRRQPQGAALAGRPGMAPSPGQRRAAPGRPPGGARRRPPRPSPRPTGGGTWPYAPTYAYGVSAGSEPPWAEPTYGAQEPPYPGGGYGPSDGWGDTTAWGSPPRPRA